MKAIVCGMVGALALAGCLTAEKKSVDAKPAAVEAAKPAPPAKPEWVAKPETFFGAPLGSKIDDEMKAAGFKASFEDRNSMAEVYHLPCSARRFPSYKFPSIGRLSERCGFYPCQVWVDRTTREIVQIVASPIEGASDEMRQATAEKFCKLFEPAFGKAKQGMGAGKVPFWQFEFNDSNGHLCRAVLRLGKEKRDGLWSYHIMMHRVIKYVVKERPAPPKKKPVASFGLFNSCRDKVAIMKVGKGNATGFVVKADGKTWLYTNEHVVHSAEKITAQCAEGPELEFAGAMEIASDRDLARLELKGQPPAFELAQKVPDLGTEICVVGNSAGGGVLTELCGRVLGQGPVQIEIDAEFVKGNSGSPVFTRDMKVVGVATHVRRPNIGAENGWISQDTRFSLPRRFAMRTDNVKWLNVDPKVYRRIVASDDK